MQDTEEEKKVRQRQAVWSACKKHLADETCTYHVIGAEHCPQFQRVEMCLLEKVGQERKRNDNIFYG